MKARTLRVWGCLLLTAMWWVQAAQAAPDQVALAQAREELRAAFEAQVAGADSAIVAGALEGRPLAEQLRKRGVGYSHLGQYDKAIADFSRAIELDGFNPQFYQDRAIAYLRSRDFRHANTDLDMVLGLDRENFSGLREKGRAAFYQGDYDTATRYFTQAARSVAHDGQFYAAIWANMSALRAGRTAVLKLQLASENSRERWPVPVADLLNEERSVEEVLQRADSSNARTYLSIQCEAHFYVGQYHLIHGRREQARESFQAAADTGKTDDLEYDWALRELEALK